MMGVPVDLDDYRSIAAVRAAEHRRQRNHRCREDRAALRRQQEEAENYLAGEPAETWTDAAAKAAYLIELFAATLRAEDQSRKALIKRTLDDFKRLSNHGEGEP